MIDMTPAQEAFEKWRKSLIVVDPIELRDAFLAGWQEALAAVEKTRKERALYELRQKYFSSGGYCEQLEKLVLPEDGQTERPDAGEEG